MIRMAQMQSPWMKRYLRAQNKTGLGTHTVHLIYVHLKRYSIYQVYLFDSCGVLHRLSIQSQDEYYLNILYCSP